MKIFRTIFTLGIVIIAIFVLIKMAQSSVSMKVVPSLAEYVASSTRLVQGTSTDQTGNIWMASSTIVSLLLSEATSTPPAPIVIKKSLKEVLSVPTTTIQKSKAAKLATSTLDNNFIRAPKGIIRLMIARTPSTRERGLGGYASLPADEGMFFIFPQATGVGFWMKDMNFPLDIVWIGPDRSVLGVAENISPDSYPKTFSSPGKVQFVLELNAGQAAVFGLKKGVRLTF